jgi:hypothetical protein
MLALPFAWLLAKESRPVEPKRPEPITDIRLSQVDDMGCFNIEFSRDGGRTWTTVTTT